MSKYVTEDQERVNYIRNIIDVHEKYGRQLAPDVSVADVRFLLDRIATLELCMDSRMSYINEMEGRGK